MFSCYFNFCKRKKWQIEEYSKKSLVAKVSAKNYFSNFQPLKFIYFEKATKFCEISSLPLSYVVPIKSNFAKFWGVLKIYELYYHPLISLIFELFSIVKSWEVSRRNSIWIFNVTSEHNLDLWLFHGMQNFLFVLLCISKIMYIRGCQIDNAEPHPFWKAV